MKKISLLLAISLFAALLSRGQDKIYRKNGKITEAKIIEIGVDEVKYREFKDPNGPIYVLETDRINKIVFENGKVENFTINIKDPEKYIGQLRKAIKIDFLGPLLGYSQISFEKNTGVGKGFEISLGVIGAGKTYRIGYYNSSIQETKRNQFGFFVSGGYKFGKLPDFILFGKTRLTHIMQGTYLKPLIYLGNYSENRIVYKANQQYEVDRQHVTFAALQVEFGKQWVFADKVLLDIFNGLGYGFDNKKDINEYFGWSSDETAAYNYANARLGRSPGLSYTFAIKLGLLIK